MGLHFHSAAPHCTLQRVTSRWQSKDCTQSSCAHTASHSEHRCHRFWAELGMCTERGECARCDRSPPSGRRIHDSYLKTMTVLELELVSRRRSYERHNVDGVHWKMWRGFLDRSVPSARTRRQEASAAARAQKQGNQLGTVKGSRGADNSAPRCSGTETKCTCVCVARSASVGGSCVGGTPVSGG